MVGCCFAVGLEGPTARAAVLVATLPVSAGGLEWVPEWQCFGLLAAMCYMLSWSCRAFLSDRLPVC